MIQTPAIVTFANQKGGVGKTTFCVAFANYLVTMGVHVAVIDCDFQHSILKCRKADMKKYGNEPLPYDVDASNGTRRTALPPRQSEISFVFSTRRTFQNV